MPSDISTRPNLPALTSLRFFAALFVILAHGVMLSDLHVLPAFKAILDLHFSVLGMTLFFTLSGFVIQYNYSQYVTTQGYYGRLGFLWARFARLYPLFLVFLAADFFLGLEIVRAAAGAPSRLSTMIAALPYYLSFTHSWFYSWQPDRTLIFEYGTAMQVSWSISTEWFFYLAFLLLVYPIGMLKSARSIILAGLAFVIVWSVLWSEITLSKPLDEWAMAQWGPITASDQYSFKHWLTYYSPYAQVGTFIVGCLTAQLYLCMRERELSPSEERLGAILGVCGFLSLLIVMVYGYDYRPFAAIVSNIGMAPSCAIIIFTLARYPTFVTRLLSLRPVVALGEASYSLYLVHMVALGTVFNLRFSQYSDPTSGLIVTLVQFVAAIVLACVLALGLYRVIEVPSRRWMRSLWPSRKSAYIASAEPGIASQTPLVDRSSS